MSGCLDEKIAIITGAGQWPRHCLTLAQEGATCVLVDVNPDWANETLDMIGGGDSIVVTADVTDERACQGIVQQTLQCFGPIDVLHSNVGMSKGDRATPDLDCDVWDRLMTLNLKSMFMLCKATLPTMRTQGRGTLITISSTASKAMRPTVAYKTSKGAINTFTQHVAAENAKFGVRANALLPGLINTPMAIERRAQEPGRPRKDIQAERDALVPMGYRGNAWDVANAAVFLASDEAKYITGVLLPGDGGLLLKRG